MSHTLRSDNFRANLRKRPSDKGQGRVGTNFFENGTTVANGIAVETAKPLHG